MLFIHASVSELHGSMEIKIEKSSCRVVEFKQKLLFSNECSKSKYTEEGDSEENIARNKETVQSLPKSTRRNQKQQQNSATIKTQ